MPALPLSCLLFAAACAGAGPQRAEGTLGPSPAPLPESGPPAPSMADGALGTWSIDATVPPPAALTAMLKEAEAASRSDAAAEPCSRLIVHRHLVGVRSVSTFMVGSPDATMELSLRFADQFRTARPWHHGHRLATVEEKLASELASGKNDGPAHANVTLMSALPNGGGRFSFVVTGDLTTYGLCHGLYEHVRWRGTLDVDDAGQVVSAAMTGVGTVVEDVCDSSEGGGAGGRKVLHAWDTRYSGKFSNTCGEDDDGRAR